ncbi:Nicotinamidase-related amidase [Thermoactinomyces sp. DSM 45891]|uniref:isochorismatase family protein n=1 Tax=Thermoactinomyces sp. DSM 45891 TaxID=1761907 RepID=UPI00091623DB|nr:isochorismatase family protein [Thermoactinomyces sp. DSM 45891]SFX28885.1 Nicotinamidase-related amidase [Thermoactinomyces sp. DSM 45891]
MTNINTHHEFLTYIQNNVQQSPTWTVDELLTRAGEVENLYLVYVDIIKGFCDVGPLSSSRVREMVQPVKQLTDSLLERGLLPSNLIFLHDAHPEQAVEFNSFVPHCVHGTVEAEIVDELRSYQDLPGAQTYSKNATNGLFGVNQEGIPFHETVKKIFDRNAKSTFVMVGDCTDLCIYQNAMGIRLLANQQNADVEVIVPISHVRTYDLPIDVAKEIGAFAHNADFFDIVFLYHMKANGITLVTNLLEKKEV